MFKKLNTAVIYTLEYNTYEYKEVIYVFYGRKQELKTLEKEYLKKNSLCSIYGARRIAKNIISPYFLFTHTVVITLTICQNVSAKGTMIMKLEDIINLANQRVVISTEHLNRR